MRGSAHQFVVDRFRSLKRSGEEYIERQDVAEFYTLLTSTETYRKLIRSIGLEDATAVLAAINDMALAKATRSKATWFISAQREKAFADSLIRTSEAFFAFSNGSFLIDGLEEERLDVVSADLRLSFQLENFENPHELHFSFDKKSVIPKNIAVIIGQNGVGKSQSLSRIVTAALSNDLSVFSEPGGGRPMISRILALATPGETAHTFPPPPKKRESLTNYRRLSLARGSTGTSADGLPDLVHQLARSAEKIRSARRWELFIKTLKTIFDIDSIAFRLRPAEGSYEYTFGGSNYASLKDFVAGTEGRLLELRRRLILTDSPRLHTRGKFYPMSSGQLSFFRFALHACLFIENGTLVLLDEPETHLHPNLISEFVILLDRLLSETGSIAIISTHSAYFVREVLRSQVQVLRTSETETGKRITCEHPRLGTFGSNVGAISHFVFEDDLSTFLTRLIGKSLDAAALEQIKHEISLEAYLKIRDRLSEANK
jgi:energy-coupling factor transporter ATP-binding protein EcfA2